MTNLITYTWKIETLTPLHIGSGIRLRQGFDFIADKDKIWVADQAAIYEHLIDRAESHAGRHPTEIKNLIRMTLDDIVKNKWLELQDFNLAPAGVFSYVLKGTPSATEGRGEVQAFIRDGFGRPYIPGSSIKGALRSALLRHLARQTDQPIDVCRKPTHRGYDGRFAATIVEKNAYVGDERGRDKKPQDPNLDIWRAIRVQDAQPVPVETLELANAIVFPAQSNSRTVAAIPVDLEVIPEGVIFTAAHQIDQWLLASEQARSVITFPQEAMKRMENLIRTVNEETVELLNGEQGYLKSLNDRGITGWQEPARIRAMLVKVLKDLKANEMLISIGRGTGWNAKTLGKLLQNKQLKQNSSPYDFNQLVADFRLGRGKWRKDMEIPFTRLLATTHTQVRAPMGWIKITMEQQ